MKKCKQGYYYCYDDKKCKKIPSGYRVGLGGWLRKEKEEEKSEDNGDTESKKKGNGNGDNADGGAVSEGWSEKYKKSIDCKNPKGFSQRAHCQGRKKVNEETIQEGKRDGKSAKDKGYSLRDWFKGGGWVQAGGKYDGKPCAKQPGQKTKPFCRDADDRASMSKKERNRRTDKKRREDPNPNRKGKAKMVTDSYSNWRQELAEVYNKPDAQYKDLKGRNSDTSPTGGQRPPKPLDPRNKPGIDSLTGLKLAHYQPEGELVEQIRDGKPGDGFIGPTIGGYGIPNPIRIAQDAYDIQVRRLRKNVNDVNAAGGGYTGNIKQTGQKTYNPSTSDAYNKFFGRPRPEFAKDSFEPEGELVKEEGKKDACYYKVKSRYSVWPSAYASGALVKCRKVGAKNWGNKSKKEGYEFSNWRDDFQPTEFETTDLITPDPIQVPPSKLQKIEEKCWVGYKQVGMKKKGGKMVPNCVKEGHSNWREELSEKYAGAGDKGMPGWKPYGGRETGPVQDPNYLYDRIENIRKSIPVKKASAKKTTQVAHFEPEGELIEDWQRVNRKDKTDGMSQKAVNAYKRENPGSKLKTAVTGKVKKGSKDAKRRKSFCSRSDGQRKMHNIDCSKTPDKAICKARRRWKC